MTLRSLASRVRRALNKPPAHVARRILVEARRELDRFTEPPFGRRFGLLQLLERTQARDIDELWARLIASPGWPFAPTPSPADYEACCPGDTARIVAAAERAMRHEIDLLGSGPVSLGPRIDWHRDYKTGDRWPLGYFRGIDYINRGRPSDVKTVWELSRLHWVLPCGQAYGLTRDERYAEATREIVEQWIDANPYACSVNWGVTMEPSLRILSWAWLLRTCGASAAWRDREFRSRFLCMLYLHAVFVEKFIERSDVNGNHFTANAAALVVAGALICEGHDAEQWLSRGLADLEREIVLQVHPDGVDFEASTAYHRLVAELFLFAAMSAGAPGRGVSPVYRMRLKGMAEFVLAYTRVDGTTPLWGDADDGRVLPMGGQPITDHRYLPGLIGLFLNDQELVRYSAGPRGEAAWIFGVAAAMQLPTLSPPVDSKAFSSGGFFVMRAGADHVFVDCGPLGLAGRGGHDHNDMLSFEAALDGHLLICDRGAYVYTASFESRNDFRATASHNTALIDGQEINRIAHPEWLWSLEHDAHPIDAELSFTEDSMQFNGSHDGYARLNGAPRPHRTIILRPAAHKLTVRDTFAGRGVHRIEIPLHLAPGVAVRPNGGGRMVLTTGRAEFCVDWSAGGSWTVTIEETSISPSYGVAIASVRIVWRANADIRDLWLDVRISALQKLAEQNHDA
jgi:Heparinase II/III-like protein/Heparinase II/III N-terminus